MSDIILLNNGSAFLTHEWYNKKLSDPEDEAIRVVKTAAKIKFNF